MHVKIGTGPNFPCMHITKLPATRWQDYKKLRLEAVADSPESFTTTAQETLSTPDEEWQEKIHTMFFAVTENDEVIGMAGCYFEDKEKLAHIAHVVSVFVHPDHRGKGIGKQLVQVLLSDAKSNAHVKKIELGVVVTQKVARQLYESLGFKKVGELKKAIQVDGIFYDAYLMEMMVN